MIGLFYCLIFFVFVHYVIICLTYCCVVFYSFCVPSVLFFFLLYSTTTSILNSFFFYCSGAHRDLHSFPTRRSSDLVHYQPKAELRTGRVLGVEALLRWEHKRYGAVPPDEFIPLAESTGLMRRLTMFVLRESLEQLARWHEMGFAELHTAVNLSARSLIDLELADEVQQLLVETGVPAEKLTLEITETQMM